jgi:microcystin degradation protein MlrC
LLRAAVLGPLARLPIRSRPSAERRSVIAQDLSRALVATIADLEATQTLRQQGAKPGDAFDMAIGGRVDASAGEPVRIKGTLYECS